MFHSLPDNLHLYYELHGPENAPETLLFLNGLSQSTLAWGGLMGLAQKHRLLLVDVIGQGQSQSAEEFRTFDAHAADVAHLVQALGMGKVNVVGISYGGAVAMRLLVNHPELCRRGILLSTFANKNPHFNAIGESWVSALHCGGYPLMLDVMLPIALGKSYYDNPVLPIEVLKNSKATQSPSTDNLLKLMQATETSGNYLPELQNVQCPVLIVHGEEDMLCTPQMGRDMHQAISGSRFEVLPKAGHTLNLEAIPQLYALISGFIEEASA